MKQKNNFVGWFEIPVSNMDRAIDFYQTVFSTELERNNLGALDMAWFPWIENGMGAPGSLVYSPDAYTPSNNGVLIYFTAHSGDLNNELSKVESAGGTIIREKTLITEDIGYMAIILDTEGNRIALHSRQ